ncbi:hypothetical protein LXL04_020595 [Taraxacum kok-saghyz]
MALPNAGVVVRTALLMVLPRPEAEVTLVCRSAIHPNLPPGMRMYLGLNKPSDPGQLRDGETQTRASHRISHDPKDYAALGYGVGRDDDDRKIQGMVSNIWEWSCSYGGYGVVSHRECGVTKVEGNTLVDAATTTSQLRRSDRVAVINCVFHSTEADSLIPFLYRILDTMDMEMDPRSRSYDQQIPFNTKNFSYQILAKNDYKRPKKQEKCTPRSIITLLSHVHEMAYYVFKNVHITSRNCPAFEVRKTSDGCIRNCPCEPTLSESDFEPDFGHHFCEPDFGHHFCEPDFGHHFPNMTYEPMPSELDLRA